MDLKELNREELAALAALVKFAVFSDGVVSENEAGEIDAIVSEIGDAAYQQAMDDAVSQVKDMAGLEKVIAKVTREGARELLLGTILEISVAESIDPREGRLLDLLYETWGIKPEFQDMPGETDAAGSDV